MIYAGYISLAFITSNLESVSFKSVDKLTNFDVRHCHKWAQLLVSRKQKLSEAQAAVAKQDFDLAKKLYSQIVNGFMGGKQADPGMAGSLLYHIAMVSKMESETQVVLDELKVSMPGVSAQLGRIYCDFESDAKELTQSIAPLPIGLKEAATSARLRSEEKIALFNKLKQESKKAEALLKAKDPKASAAMEKAYGIT